MPSNDHHREDRLISDRRYRNYFGSHCTWTRDTILTRERRSTDSLAVDHPGVVAALRFIHDQISMTDVVKHVAMSRNGLE